MDPSSPHQTPIDGAAPIDPSLVPTRTIRGGALVPAIGLGTFGSDHVSAARIAASVGLALKIGYRHIDCAAVYANEDAIGPVLHDAIGKGIGRDELWISSKVWNDSHDHVAAACEQTLRDLQLDHLDMYLVHWPFPNFHPPHCDVDERNPDAVPYAHERFMQTWEQMESLVERGLVRHIGTSNMSIAKLGPVLDDATVQPSVNQMELHPHFQQPALHDWLIAHDIAPIGFCPIGSPARPARDTTENDTVPTSDPIVMRIAERLGVHPAVVCVKWAQQRGQIPIPFSTSPANIRANLQAVTTEPLTAQDMTDIRAADQGCRLIKGQVFLWKDDQDWTDLWDEDGVIAD